MRTEHVMSGGVAATSGREEMGNGCERMNIVQVLCTHVLYGKMIPSKTVLAMVVGR
jgi:hypothetical protein